MHVIVQIVISLLSEFDFLQVDFDADFVHIDVLQAEIFLKSIGALVSDVSEGVEKLFGPVFEQRDLLEKGLSLVSQKLLERLAFLDFEEVLVEVSVGHVVETEVGWAVFGEKELFGSSDLVEHVGQDFIVLKAFGDLVALDWVAVV